MSAGERGEPLVECVPNFSEGRDPAAVGEIAAAIAGVAGVTLLDSSSDYDHHRSVFTFAGRPEPTCEAAVRAAGCAARLIDLRQHAGVHPRIGAADVIPFVPLHGVTLEDCARLAERCATALWERFRIPSYLYEAAARHPERVRLENLRRSGFGGLPDIGDDRHPTAGIAAVGARKFLIAWNIILDSENLAAARGIARKIRTSSGGLPAVKAMGLELRSRRRVQVSINLVDFEQTPLHVVSEAVVQHAARLGIGVAGSELIGLIPARALDLSSGHDLRWLNMSPDHVLEARLARLRTLE